MSSTLIKRLSAEEARAPCWSEGFQRDHSRDKRQQVAQQRLAQHPDWVPVVMDRVAGCELDLSRHLQVVPPDWVGAQFIARFRERVKLEPHEGLYFFLKNKSGEPLMLAPSKTFKQMQAECAQDDSFLYISFGKEHTFG